MKNYIELNTEDLKKLIAKEYKVPVDVVSLKTYYVNQYDVGHGAIIHVSLIPKVSKGVGNDENGLYT